MNANGVSGESEEASTRNSKVPRFRYPTARANATAEAMIFSRSASGRPGAGAISTSC
jgi:hypothetical protein